MLLHSNQSQHSLNHLQNQLVYVLADANGTTVTTTYTPTVNSM